MTDIYQGYYLHRGLDGSNTIQVQVSLSMSRYGCPNPTKMTRTISSFHGFRTLARKLHNHLTHYLNICDLFFICTLGIPDHT